MLSQVTISKSYLAFDLEGFSRNRDDSLLYKTVEIIEGPNKGYWGEVRAVGNEILIVAMEVNHCWERVPTKNARYVNRLSGSTFFVYFLYRELKVLPLLPSPVRPSTPGVETREYLSAEELATLWDGGSTRDFPAGKHFIVICLKSHVDFVYVFS